MEHLTLHGYFNKYIRGKMSYPIFLREKRILMSDKEFAGKFGEYRQAYKLSKEQIALLNEEFGV